VDVLSDPNASVDFFREQGKAELSEIIVAQEESERESSSESQESSDDDLSFLDDPNDPTYVEPQPKKRVRVSSSSPERPFPAKQSRLGDQKISSEAESSSFPAFDPFAPSYFDKLPLDCLIHVFSYLNCAELCSSLCVCRHWRFAGSHFSLVSLSYNQPFIPSTLN